MGITDLFNSGKIKEENEKLNLLIDELGLSNKIMIKL